GLRGWDGALPTHVRPETFTRIVISTISQNPDLLKCNEKSLFSAIMTLAQLGLAPENVLGQGYLVPYKGVCQPIVGYKGLIQLARRSGDLSEFYAHPVYSRDVFDYSLGLERTLKHEPSKNEDRGELVYVYAVVKYKDG